VVLFRDEAAPVATVIVVGLREAPTLIACVESIAENVEEVAYELLIVLNDPTPELCAELEQRVSGATVFNFRANLGFGGAVNFAAERARGEYIVLLNDDCAVTRGWLESLVETVQRRFRCVAVGSTFLNPDGTLQEAGAVVWSDGSTSAIGDDVEAGDMQFERRCDYCSGGSLLIRKDVWEQLSGFDQSYYPAYFEDVDFCLRAAEVGWETWYQPLAVVRHARFMSTGVNLRHYLWQRGHDTFVNRWSRLLETREPNGAVERAVWRAMGAPIRVLLIGEEVRDPDLGSGSGPMHEMLSTLAREPDIHVTFFPTAPRRERAVHHGGLPKDFPFSCVRMIIELEEHLASSGVEFDAAVVSPPRNGAMIRELLTRYVPHARLIDHAIARSPLSVRDEVRRLQPSSTRC
jgi:GT2 family glycosyltransferase